MTLEAPAEPVKREGEFVPGIYSNVGKSTEFEINGLRVKCELDEDPVPAVFASPSKAKNNSKKLPPKVKPVVIEKSPRPPGLAGDLARAIAERLEEKQRQEEQAKAKEVLAAATDKRNFGHESPVVTPGRTEKLTSSFAGPGIYDTAWTSKFTASRSPGALNRWEEQRPDPCWYKVQYGMVLDRVPAWDFAKKKPHQPRKRPGDQDEEGEEDGAGLHAFLTGLDLEEDQDGPNFGRRFTLKQQEPRHAGNFGQICLPQGKTAWALAQGHLDLGKASKLTLNEVSCPAKDVLQQDIKGYPKQRPAEVDFAKAAGRSPLMNGDHIMPPGKYDPQMRAVWGNIKSGLPFGKAWNPKAMDRSVSDGQLGHFAPIGALQPDEKRFPGGISYDRSRAKDSVRPNPVHVNDFPKEMSRPDLPPASKEYHNKKDPVACEITLRHQLTYDHNKADVLVTKRRNIGPSYAKMTGRGRDAVQGVRALQADLGVRGSVGLGFAETTGQKEHSVQRLEGRAADAFRVRPDVGPVFDRYTEFQPLCAKNNFNHGYAPVQGGHEPKRSPLQKPGAENSFKREVLWGPKGPGFSKKSPLSATKGQKTPKVLRQSRTHEALPGWSDALLKSE
eukprot:TRINITY_DN27556_c0_g1_i8.p1 TRINITY_DN27556_c0_g1~~TRINITY_DN27556_c0_g1_i8.p1  ORF type:complete len:615 (+),score=106.11 TRINITY_DN27556_c0_g1_i8:207-2051(+)